MNLSPCVLTYQRNTQTSSSSQTWGNFLKDGEIIFLYLEDRYIVGFATKWPLNDSRTWLSSLCMQMQLPSIESWFTRNLWRCSRDKWWRLHFLPTSRLIVTVSQLFRLLEQLNLYFCVMGGMIYYPWLYISRRETLFPVLPKFCCSARKVVYLRCTITWK